VVVVNLVAAKLPRDILEQAAGLMAREAAAYCKLHQRHQSEPTGAIYADLASYWADQADIMRRAAKAMPD